MKKLAVAFGLAICATILAYGFSFAQLKGDALTIPGVGEIKGWKAFHMKHGAQAAFKAKIENYKAPGCANSHCHSAMPAKAENGPKDIKATCTNSNCHDAAKLKTNIAGLK